MRRHLGAVMALVLGLIAPLAGVAQSPAQDLIPDRRILLSQDLDRPGADIVPLFDTTLDPCARACLVNP